MITPDHCDACRWFAHPDTQLMLDGVLRSFCEALAGEDDVGVADVLDRQKMGIEGTITAGLVRDRMGMDVETLSEMGDRLLALGAGYRYRWSCTESLFARPFRFKDSSLEPFYLCTRYVDGQWRVGWWREAPSAGPVH